MKKIAELIAEEDLNDVYNDFLDTASVPSGWKMDDTGLTTGYDDGYFPFYKKISGFPDVMIGMWLDESQRVQFEFYLEKMCLVDLSDYNNLKEALDNSIEEGMDFSVDIRKFLDTL